MAKLTSAKKTAAKGSSGSVSLAKLPPATAEFVEPMLCEPVKEIPDGEEWDGR